MVIFLCVTKMVSTFDKTSASCLLISWLSFASCTSFDFTVRISLDWTSSLNSNDFNRLSIRIDRLDSASINTNIFRSRTRSSSVASANVDVNGDGDDQG